MSVAAQAPTRNTDRALRAYQQSADYLVLPTLEEGVWTVFKTTQRDAPEYRTTANTCSCPDHERRGLTCKHSHMVRMHEQMERETAPAPKPAPAPATPSFFAEVHATLDALRAELDW